MEALVLDLNKRYSYADYLTWVDDVRRELIDGFIKLMAGTSRFHGEIGVNIIGEMSAYLKTMNAVAKCILPLLMFCCQKTAKQKTVRYTMWYNPIYLLFAAGGKGVYIIQSGGNTVRVVVN